MSTTTKPLKYLWQAFFEDGHRIEQPADDRSSKHDENAEWNPSAFSDIQNYQKKSKLLLFTLSDGKDFYTVNLNDGTFMVNFANMMFGEELENRKLIYYREVEQNMVNGVLQDPEVKRYILGFEGKNNKGKKEQRVIYING